jgi:hypothetical protein
MQSPDYKKTLDTLSQINLTKIDGQPVTRYFLCDGNDMWGSYQMSLFSDIKAWTVNPQAYKKHKRNSFSATRLLLLCESFCALVFKNPKILLYTVDKVHSDLAQNDSRIDVLYDVLTKNNIPYLELVHTFSIRTALSNFLKRKRLVVYLEAFMWGNTKIKPKIDLTNFEDKEFGEYLVKKYLDRFHSTKRIQHIFKFISPKLVWGIDDPRYTGELLVAAKKASVPSYLFQHGHFTKYHVGWLTYGAGEGVIPRADYLVVWNEYWKKELLRLGTYYSECALLVGGEKKTDTVSIDNTKETHTILIPYETDAPKKEVKQYIKKFEEEGYTVVLKTRSDTLEQKQREEYGVTQSTPDLIPAVAVVGVYSTFLYDVLGVYPVGILQTSMDYGQGMVENGVAGGIFIEKKIRDQISQLQMVKFSNSISLYDTVFQIAKKHTCI